MAPRPLTEEDKTGLLETLTGGVSEAFSDALLLFTDRAGFINGEGSSSPLAQAARAVSQRACRVYARNPDGSGSAKQQAYLADVCGPYLDGLNETPDPGGLGDRAVTGGQCPGVTYQVQALGTNTGNGAPINLNRGNFVGPIRAQPTTDPVPNCPPPNFLSNIEFRAGNGALIVRQFGCAPRPQDLRVVCTPVTPEPPGGCGPGSEPPLVPPTPRTGLPALSPTITVGLPGFGDVQVEVGIDPSGEITVGLPDIGVEGAVSIGGGGDGDGGGSPDGEPGDIGEPAPPEDSGEGGTASGCAPEGSVLGAIKVDLLTVPPWAKTFGGGVIRAVGFAYLGTADGLDMDPAGRALRSGQLILPEKKNLTCWEFVCNPGFEVRVTPYYIALEDPSDE